MMRRLTINSRWLLIALMLAASAVRVYRLDAQSLWSDEGLSLYRARLSLGENLTNIIIVPPGVPTHDTNPPLYFIVLSVLRSVAGESEYALRFLSVMMGVLTVPLLYVLGRRLWNERVGTMTATLAAVSPFLVWYSQEARGYAALVTLNVLSMYLLLRAIHFPARATAPEGPRATRRWFIWIAWGAVTLSMLAVHFAALFSLLFEGIVLLVAWNRSRWREKLIVLAVLGVLAVPLLAYALTRARDVLDPVFRFRPLDSIAQETWSAFLVGATRDIFQPWWAVAPGLALLGLGAIAGLVNRSRRAITMLAVTYLLIPFLTYYAALFVQPLYIGPRHVIFMLPPVYLLVAAGGVWLWERWRVMGVVSLVTVLGLMLWWLGVQFTDPAYLKDDIRSAACAIAKEAQPDDVVIMSDAISSFMFDYYYRRCEGVAPWQIIPVYPSLNFETALKQFQAAANAAKRVWYLVEPRRIGGFDSKALDEWARGHLLRLDHARFASLWLGSSYQLYTAHYPIFDSLPAEATPSSAAWPTDGLNLLGWRIESVDSTQLRVSLFWQLSVPGQRNLSTALKLLDANGAILAETGGAMFDNWSVRDWPVGKVIQQMPRIDLPPDRPRGQYHLQLVVSERKSGEPLVTANGAVDVDLGPTTIEAAK